jgi:uncharacterized protein YjbI with pentapeptide repeats
MTFGLTDFIHWLGEVASMANQEQLERFKRSVEEWNQWRQENPDIKIELMLTDLSGVDLNLPNIGELKAELFQASLSKSNLTGVNLREALLILTNLSGAVLIRADLTKANLEKANLAGSYLNEATFSGANLSEADLSRADLSRADLRGADFRECRVVSTNFTAATLTGACIEDWHINSETNFENVICDYIYYKYDWQTGKYSDRRPHDPNKIFNPGDFQRLIETARETVDLIFSDGIDWETFIKSLHKLQEKFPDSDIAVQGMQKKSDGALVISIEALENIKKSVLESSWWQIYPPLLAEKDSTIRILTDELKSKRQEHTEMLTIIKTMSEKESVQQSNFYGPVGVGNNQGEIQGNAKVAGILNEAEQQNLTEIITEVQAIIVPLAQTYPNNPTTQGIKAIEAIEKNPHLKQKLIEAAKKGCLEAFKKSLDNPVGAFIGGAIEGWMGK